MTITLKQQIAELRREIGIRKNVYPRWVASKRLTQEQADERLGRMQAAVETLVEVERYGLANDPVPRTGELSF